ncbi:MAG: hypothetical protein AAF433_05600 [Bacteroidota bacterium]
MSTDAEQLQQELAYLYELMAEEDRPFLRASWPWNLSLPVTEKCMLKSWPRSSTKA